jgi:hypothetical protein
VKPIASLFKFRSDDLLAQSSDAGGSASVSPMTILA